MSTIKKAQRLLALKKNTPLELMRFMDRIEQQYDDFEKKATKMIAAEITKQATDFDEKLIKRAVATILKDIKGPRGLRGLPGMPAPKPKRGKDFFTEKDKQSMIKAVVKALANNKVAKSTVLKHGEDYLKPNEIRKMADAIFADYFSNNDRLEAKDVEKMIMKVVKDIYDVKKIARALEALPEKDRLSYKKLKDKPDLPGRKLYDDRKNAPPKGIEKSKHGGGGSGESGNNVASVDLSDQLDGATKTFAIPNHSSVIMVTCTQFPFVYRPTVDFTTTANELTLTAEVSAPEADQTLILVYAE